MICQRYLLDGIITLVDTIHAQQQLDQFAIARLKLVMRIAFY